MICVPITGPNMADALRDIESVRDVADLLELRLDLIEKFDLAKLLNVSGLDVIVTYRPIREGGQSNLSDSERLKVLKIALDAGVKYVDVEWDCVHSLPSQYLSRVISSRHFFNGFPDNVEELWAEVCALPAGVAKMAVKVEDISQNARLFHLLEKTNKPKILIGMGEDGMISRIAGKKFGNLLTFASLSKDKESAPGQIFINELIDLYRYDLIDVDTKLYGVIGNPVGHSLSPLIHNAGFDEIGWNGLYLLLKVENADSFFEALAPFFSGFSITIPHKEAFIKYADDLDPLVHKIGAMNTLVKLDSGKWFGLNTDLEAALSSIQKNLDGNSFLNKKALVLGAGGASRALIIGLKDAGAKVTLSNRTLDKGQKVAKELEIDCIPFESAARACSQFDIILNTTSVGMHPHEEESPLPGGEFKNGQIVFDAVYNPEFTLLLQEAKAKGAVIITGKEMFIGQGAIQFENWTQIEAPVTTFREILK